VTELARWAGSQLRYHFRDHALLESALTHRSASGQNNERLEFLGDAYLNFFIADRLYAIHPVASEGDLSRLRASLVNRTTLATIGRELGVDTQLILGPGELRSGGAQRDAALADTVEALIGAVLLDGGHDAADSLLAALFDRRLAELPDATALKDGKTRLQEWVQARALQLPVYRVERAHGRDHEQVFTVSCTVAERGLRTEAQGRSRRSAEQSAADAMLSELAREHDT
jgi:ribonuclease III